MAKTKKKKKTKKPTKKTKPVQVETIMKKEEDIFPFEEPVSEIDKLKAERDQYRQWWLQKCDEYQKLMALVEQQAAIQYFEDINADIYVKFLQGIPEDELRSVSQCVHAIINMNQQFDIPYMLNKPNRRAHLGTSYFVYKYSWDDGDVYYGQTFEGSGRFNNPRQYTGKVKEKMLACPNFKAEKIYTSKNPLCVSYMENKMIGTIWGTEHCLNTQSESNWLSHEANRIPPEDFRQCWVEFLQEFGEEEELHFDSNEFLRRQRLNAK